MDKTAKSCYDTKPRPQGSQYDESSKKDMIKKLLKNYTYSAVMPILALLYSTLTFSAVKFLQIGRVHWDLSIPADAAVPFLPWTVTIYLGSFVYWYLCFVFVSRGKRAEADRLFATHFLTATLSALIFVLFPTTLQRPEINGGGLWNWLTRLVYWVDTPENLFPSLHCSTGWLCWAALRRRKDLPLWTRLAALLLSLAVCVSTLTTRQHVLADVFSGVALCELDYFLASLPRVRAFFSRLFEAVERRVRLWAE